jgi:AsmA protein
VVRKLLYIVGGIVLLLVLAAVILPFVIDANQYRPKIETMLSQALNRKVDIGNIRLSLFSGGVGVDDVAIAEDPAFGSEPFLKAKGITVGVELMPLIFSRQLNVTGLTIDSPAVTLLRNPAGVWNFSSLGAAGSPATQGSAPPTASSNSAAGVSIAKLTLQNGTLSVGRTSSAKRHEYDQVNLTASNLSYTTQFPFELSAQTPGNGSVKLNGQAGPLNSTNAEQTPFNASLEVKGLDVGQTGFVDPSSGIAGIVDFSGTMASDGHQVDTKGKVTATKLQLVPGGAPAKEPVQVDYEANYALASQTGALKQGDVHIGKALARLSGTYSSAGETTTVQMKLDGSSMPATDLEAVLPALGVELPSGASLTEGTLNTNLTITGPVDKLVTAGSVNLSNGKLTGFDLGSKMGALSAFAGIPKGQDTVIQTMSSDVRVAPEGIQTNNMNVVVPSIGSITGAGTMDTAHKLDFKMVAKLSMSGSPLGGVATLMSGGQKGGGIPFKIEGTASNPTFIPDMGAAASGMAKGILGGAQQGGGAAGQNLGNALGGLFGKKKTP